MSRAVGQRYSTIKRFREENELIPATKTDPNAKPLTSLEKAQLAVDAAGDRQASDIALLDLRPLATFTDFFVLCNGSSERQVEAIGDAIEDALRQVGYKPVQREGTKTTGWVVLDYGDFVVHIFTPDERRFYALDELWSRAKPVVKIQ